MRLDRFSLFVGAVASALALTAASSLGFGVQPTAAQQAPAAMDEAHAEAQKAQVIAVIYQLDSSGFHNLDEQLAAGQMVPGALGTVRRARIATQATHWPDALQERVNQLVPAMTALEQALRDEDLVKAAPLATQVHDLEHALSDRSYTWLSGAQLVDQHGH